MRDDFDQKTREMLGKRVGYLCSNPNCRILTTGPRAIPDKAINVGVAAHICAASQGGPRYDPTMSSEERKSIENGIWLCQTCGKLVDNDEARYTVDILRAWKCNAEDAALMGIKGIGRFDSDWLQTKPKEHLIALLLAGAWEPGYDGDRKVIEKLSGGTTARKMEQLCAELSANPKGPMERRGNAWCWKVPAPVWAALAGEFTDSQFNDFRTVILDVLGEDHPRYELPPEDRWAANIQDKTPRCSPSLRIGLAESLVRLTLHDEQIKSTYGQSVGRPMAHYVVRELLGQSWLRWASIDELLPILAEASPGSFLEALQASLSNGKKGVVELMKQESQMGPNPHHHLFWALEGLAWSEDYLLKVVHCFARLAAEDPGGNWANRPIKCLSNILHFAMPQTTASVETRLAALRAVARRHEQVVWEVASGYIHRFGGEILTTNHRPRFLSWLLPPSDAVSPPAEIKQFVLGIENLLLELVGNRPERWNDLIDAMDHRIGHLEAQVLERLENQKDELFTNDPDCKIWDSFRHFLNLGSRKKERGDEEEEMLQRVNKLYRAFEPHDIVKKVSWLFNFRAVIPNPVLGDWEENERRTRKLRREALQEVLSNDDPWQVVQKLANAVEHKGLVGSMLAELPESKAVEDRLLESSLEESSSLSILISGFIARRTGLNGLDWLDSLILRFKLNGRQEDAVTAALSPSATSDIWKLLEKYDDSLRRRYWQRVTQVWWCETREKLEYAVKQLLKVDRPHIALEAASHALSKDKNSVTVSTAFTILSKLKIVIEKKGPEEFLRDDLRRYDLEELFKIVDEDESIRDQEIVPIEIFFLPILYHSEHPAGRLFRYLEQNPEFFTILVDLRWKKESEVKEKVESPETVHQDVDEGIKTGAEAAHRILEAWKTYPGCGLYDNTREETALEWVQSVLKITKAQDHEKMGKAEVAEVLARMPPYHKDDCWPCRTARELIRSDPYLARRLLLAKVNLRGVVTRSLGEGGKQERELADRFRQDARKIEANWPETATLLENLARSYDRDAERADLKHELF